MLEDQIAKLLQINYFLTFQNNHVNYARFSDHNNLGMIENII
jgi:hypothetical protein